MPTDISAVNRLDSELTSMYCDDGNLLVKDFWGDYFIADMDTANAVQYFGYLTLLGDWYIKRFDTNANSFRFVKGKGSYPTEWTNRASQIYDYMDIVF